MQKLNVNVGDRVYVNVMENLVFEEAEQQLHGLPMRVRRYIRVEEVVTYALNRLPALYASSEKGWQYQRQLAQQDLRAKIQDAVRQGVVAVQVDPIRLSRPIQITQERDAESEAVLQTLKILFKKPELDWATALQQLHALQQKRQANATPATEKRTQFEQTAAWRPGTYGHQISWKQRQQKQTSPPAQVPQQVAKGASGWDDVHYRL
ncbi:MAG: late competence development ComFB family protein [Cyanobacteria bacterium P01_H01_bin.58]